MEAVEVLRLTGPAEAHDGGVEGVEIWIDDPEGDDVDLADAIVHAVVGLNLEPYGVTNLGTLTVVVLREGGENGTGEGASDQ